MPANPRRLQRSFGGGEISPYMYGRIADSKYQSGLALCRNFRVRPQGPVENRSGLAYVNEVVDSTKKTRILPFTYSTTQTMVIELAAGYIRFHTQGETLMNGASPYQITNPYAEADLFDIHYVQSNDVLTLSHPNHPTMELRRLGATDWALTQPAFTSPIAAPTGVTATPSGGGTGYTYDYLVTSIGADGISESEGSAVASCTNNLLVTGNTNAISWAAVSGATLYNVYKLQGGVYGYIGQTAGTSITDDNITPDLTTTPPTYDATFEATSSDYPGAVSYYEQRRCFAGTINAPQELWCTRSGTESDMSYSLPTRSDDRIKIRIAARESNTIRHLVPLNDLLALTSSAVWRVASFSGGALSPTNISVKPQSYTGASNVQPQVVNNTMLYVAALGGHVQELAYSWQANGFVVGDVSLRASHLFDTYDLTDMAYMRAYQPTAWFVSTTGKLLGLTYAPEQEVGAWHQHDTYTVAGQSNVESVCVVAENYEDVLYCVVNRTINGATVRYIERMATRRFSNVEDVFFVDAGLSFDFTNTSATTMTLSGGTSWAAGEVLTLTASTASFASTDPGDTVVLTDSTGVQYTCAILAYTSATTVTVQCDKAVPAALQGVATTSWAWGRLTISGLAHLEGETVSILGDGAVRPQKTVTGGSITLDAAATKGCIGLPITADLQTLPLTIHVDAAFGDGRAKAIDNAWMRVYESRGIFAGPDFDDLTEYPGRTDEPYGSAPDLKSDEIELPLTPSWAAGGQVCVRQIDPLPLTIANMTLQVALGG